MDKLSSFKSCVLSSPLNFPLAAAASFASSSSSSSFSSFSSSSFSSCSSASFSHLCARDCADADVIRELFAGKSNLDFAQVDDVPWLGKAFMAGEVKLLCVGGIVLFMQS